MVDLEGGRGPSRISNMMSALLCVLGLVFFLTVLCHASFSQLPRVSTMNATRRPNGRDGTLSELNAAIATLNHAREAASAQVAFGTGNSSIRRVGFPPVR